MPVQRGDDLPGFDPIAPDFDLLVDAPQERDLAIWQVAGQVARLIQAGPPHRTEGGRKENLSGQSGAGEKTPVPTNTPHVEHPPHPALAQPPALAHDVE